ncbi:MAG: adenine phosphoribosyltransferase [Deltaproteobacteria bacterium]|nr:adenine phosphoribosyltransferase [Deltaproteobacteria bacterium]
MIEETLDRLMRDVPDFPKPGIVFKDITPLLADASALREVAQAMAAPWRDRGVTHVVGVESRGFLFGTAVAMELGVGLILVRKPGKLPCPTYSADYTLEYGTDRLEIHQDALDSGSNVVVVDDVLATGGTAGAVAELIAQGGGQLAGFGFLLELGFLAGREKLPSGAAVESLKIL